MSCHWLQKKEYSSYTSVTCWIRTLFPNSASSPVNIYAANKGIALHKDIENYYKQKPVVNDSAEYQQFMSFVQEHAHLTPYWIERHIQTEDLHLTGVVDMVYIDDYEQYWLYDWKRSKGLDDVSQILDIHTLQDVPYSLTNLYVLQLNLYRIIMEMEYDMNIQEMRVVLFHPSNTDYTIVDIPRLHMSLERDLIEMRRASVASPFLRET